MAARDFSTSIGKGLRRKENLRARCSVMGLDPSALSPGKALAAARDAKVLKKENKSLKEENVRLKKKQKQQEKDIASKDREIAKLRRKRDELDAELRKKDAEIARLRGKSPSPDASAPCDASPQPQPQQKNSNNSSIPPSKNPIGVRHTASLREPSGKKPGGQEGHPGRTRAQETDSAKITETRTLCPPEKCPVCGKGLDRGNLVEVERRQVVDIPFDPRLIYRNYVSMGATCTCGHCCKGEFPDEARANTSFGPNLRATVAYLSTHMALPYNKIQDFFKTFYSLDISQGTIRNIIIDAAARSKPAYDTIRDLVAHSAVVGMDETGSSVSEDSRWIWVAQTFLLTLFAFSKSRGRKVIKELFAPEELGMMMLVTDRHSAYFNDEIKAAGHQVCIAHVIRNLTYTATAYPKDTSSLDAIRLLKDAILYRHEHGTDAVKKEEFEKDLAKILERPPVYTNRDGTDTEVDALKKGLSKHIGNIFNFLLWDDVPTTNNGSEKELRQYKIKHKVSGGFRSEDGGKDYVTMASVLRTAIKNGANPMEAFLHIMTGHLPPFLDEIRKEIESRGGHPMETPTQ